jgi:metallo-beta-lactamase class B
LRDIVKCIVEVNRRTFLIAIASVGSRSVCAARDGAPDLWELPVTDMKRIAPTMWVKELAPAVWITCFTFDTPDLGYVPCNGLIIAGLSGPTIIDTGVTSEQGALLLSTAKRLTGEPATRAIATHFHNDRTGGVEAMRAANIPVLAHPYSVGLAQAYGAPVPQPVKGLEKGPVRLDSIELFFPGAGHTRDNITIWHQESGTLFGGCLLRATTDNGVGSLSDADIVAYRSTVDRLAKRYPERRFTIPGHGTIAGDALSWTRGRVSMAISKKARAKRPLPLHGSRTKGAIEH